MTLLADNGEKYDYGNDDLSVHKCRIKVSYNVRSNAADAAMVSIYSREMI